MALERWVIVVVDVLPPRPIEDRAALFWCERAQVLPILVVEREVEDEVAVAVEGDEVVFEGNTYWRTSDDEVFDGGLLRGAEGLPPKPRAPLPAELLPLARDGVDKNTGGGALGPLLLLVQLAAGRQQLPQRVLHRRAQRVDGGDDGGELFEAAETAAAVRIQSRERGRQARRQVAMEGEAAIQIQSSSTIFNRSKFDKAKLLTHTTRNYWIFITRI